MSNDTAPPFRRIGERVRQYIAATRSGVAPNTIRLSRGEINRCLFAHFSEGFAGEHIDGLRAGGLLGDWRDVSAGRLYHMARFLRFCMVAGDFGDLDPVGHFGSRTASVSTLARLFQNPVGERGALLGLLLLAGWSLREIPRIGQPGHRWADSRFLLGSRGSRRGHLFIPDLLEQLGLRRSAYDANERTLGYWLNGWAKRHGGIEGGRGLSMGLSLTGKYLRFFVNLGPQERVGEPMAAIVASAFPWALPRSLTRVRRQNDEPETTT